VKRKLFTLCYAVWPLISVAVVLVAHALAICFVIAGPVMATCN
jgi:hypothetical protein